MTRTLSWLGWVVAGCALLAAVIVWHALTRPARPQHDFAALDSGATLATLPTPAGPRLFVTSLRTGGHGEEAGLRVGDRIEDVDGLPAPTMAAFAKDVASGSYSVVDLRVSRGGALLDLHLPRGQKGA